jgi:nitrite reductase/ring-hydroxylating ferredoxin subunit
LARDLPVGKVWRRQLAGRHLAVFRTASGALGCLDAHCPHLGADMAVGGAVEGEHLRCPFHGFTFDVQGACVATPYGQKVPPLARCGACPVVERAGLVLAWHGAAGEAPSFAITDIDRASWTPWREHVFDLRGHPQEIAENGVDFGHFVAVHGYQNVQVTAPLEPDGPILRAAYAFDRPRGLQGSGLLTTSIRILQHGLGYALVEAHVANLGVRTRQLVLALPLGDDRMQLRIALAVDRSVQPRQVHPLLAWLPAGGMVAGWLAERIADRGMAGYIEDVEQDLPIWQHKAHLPRPALAAGDGPVGPYRKWVRQFYPQSASVEAA